MTSFSVGDIVVLFAYGSAPCQHNSREFPDHPCRGRVLKVGRKWLHVSSSGGPIRVPIDETVDGWKALPVDEAKRVYREGFNTPGQWRTPEFIDECVESL